MSEFEPKIIGFLCNWCSYAGADLAGVSRFQYPTNIRSVRVMCSTRVAPHIVLEILKAGADGVLVGGCHLGDCHYINGNYYTQKRIKLTRKLMELAGIDPSRLRLEWVSASEGEKFATVVSEFTNQIRELGPNQVKGDESLTLRLEAAIAASKGFRLKVLNGKEIKLTEKGNVYDQLIEPGRFDQITEMAAEEEFKKAMIIELTKSKAMSVKELSSAIGDSPSRILEFVSTLRGRNMMELETIDGFTPRYKALILGGA